MLVASMADVGGNVGDWAGGVWSQTPQCSNQASSCQDYVQNNPGAFAGAYWTINSLKVFTATSAVKKDVVLPSPEFTPNMTTQGSRASHRRGLRSPLMHMHV